MIIDLNKVENPNITFKKFDLCIVGAGAAGIAIAQNLNDENFSVCLIEAGGEDYSYESQKRYDGNWTNEMKKYKKELCWEAKIKLETGIKKACYWANNTKK